MQNLSILEDQLKTDLIKLTEGYQKQINDLKEEIERLKKRISQLEEGLNIKSKKNDKKKNNTGKKTLLQKKTKSVISIDSDEEDDDDLLNMASKVGTNSDTPLKKRKATFDISQDEDDWFFDIQKNKWDEKKKEKKKDKKNIINEELDIDKVNILNYNNNNQNNNNNNNENILKNQEKKKDSLPALSPLTPENEYSLIDLDEFPNSNSSKNNKNNRIDEKNPQKYQQSIRNKKEREELPAQICKVCAQWYEAVGMHYSIEDLIQKCSRHRAKDEAPDTPTDYWRLSFPESQDDFPENLTTLRKSFDKISQNNNVNNSNGNSNGNGNENIFNDNFSPNNFEKRIRDQDEISTQEPTTPQKSKLYNLNQEDISTQNTPLKDIPNQDDIQTQISPKKIKKNAQVESQSD